MKKLNLEIMVGLFALMGMAALGWLSIKLARMELVGSNHMPLYAKFSSISGLKIGASVEIAGVRVGKVDAITLDRKDFEAQVLLKIQPGIAIQEDAVASIRTNGLIGDRYVSISPGGSEQILRANQTITETEPAINFEGLISQFVHGSIN